MHNLYEETMYILKKYGILANKKLGQNFLVNENVVKEIVERAEISKNDFVIEIGPGLGTLTKQLLESAGKVMAIELDKNMIKVLQDRFKIYNNFELINNDILKIDLNEIIKNNINVDDINTVKIVANLPYYITTPIIMKLLEEKLNIESITVMVQKEVADRIIETPGGKNTGAITYAVYYYAKAKEILNVMPDSFVPQPSVESKVIKLEVRKEKSIKVISEELMFKIIKYSFMQRRKTFVNSLQNSGIFKSKLQILEILKTLNLNERIRGEVLSLEDYANIANIVTKM